MSDFPKSNDGRTLGYLSDEMDPLLPISEEHQEPNGQSHSHKSPEKTHHSHDHSSMQKYPRRASFGTAFLSESHHHNSQISNEIATSPKHLRNASLSVKSLKPTHEEHSEIDALGMIHNDLSGTSLNSEMVGGGGSSFIDHTRSTQFAASPRKPLSDAKVYHKRNLSLSSSGSSRNKYIPFGSQPPPPPPQSRPSFAEQWVRKHNSVDYTPIVSNDSGLKYPSSTFATDAARSNYGTISLEDKERHRNSAERRNHMSSQHHNRYSPMGDAPFTDDFTDTAPRAHHNNRSSSSGSDDFEFSGSNPSSRRSSDSASLDDVCFPLVDINEQGTQKTWPNILVLQEFAEEEKKELNEISKRTADEFREQHQSQQQQPVNDYTRNSSFSSASHIVNFQRPLVTSIDANAPLSKLGLNETEPINGRLRPPKVVPWDPKSRQQETIPFLFQSENAIPTLQHGMFDYSRDLIEQFRFTYFREELDSTIHSPNISGLVRDGQSFDHLFTASYYGNLSNSMSGSGPLESTNIGTLRNNNSSAQVSGTPTVAKTPTPSIRGQELAEVSPFWLDVLNPTEEEMKVLSKAFGIHPLTTEDIFLGETREKVELFRDYYFVCFRSFDIVHERYKQKKAYEKKAKEHEEDANESHNNNNNNNHESKINSLLSNIWKRRKSTSSNKGTTSSISSPSINSSLKRKLREQKLKINKQKGGYRHNPREGELAPLNMYIIVFREGVITFHFAPTPHPVNVRRRARLLRDYLTVSADWIGYALIDDITDAFAPMIESIEDEVNSIEDAILKMNSYNSDDSDSDSDESSSEDEDDDDDKPFWKKPASSSTDAHNLSDDKSSYSKKSRKSNRSTSTKLSSSSTSSMKSRAHIAGWKRKGDMLRRIGECRKKVMSILRLLGSKADVIKGFAKRCNEQWEVAPRSEIGMYLGDIQDHIVTMVQSLNHYEKLLARSHSNYLAQINIDMTRVNNDMNDVLGKITILGTVVLPMNIITGLWGMNVLVPGQDVDSLQWFFGILFGMCTLAFLCFAYAKRAAGFIA